VLGTPRRVVNVKRAIRAALLHRVRHRRVLPGLVTGNIVVVRDLIAAVTDMRFALVRGMSHKNPVLRVEHDHRLRLVLKA
jgi:hypothetical protein